MSLDPVAAIFVQIVAAHVPFKSLLMLASMFVTAWLLEVTDRTGRVV